MTVQPVIVPTQVKKSNLYSRLLIDEPSSGIEYADCEGAEGQGLSGGDVNGSRSGENLAIIEAMPIH